MPPEANQQEGGQAGQLPEDQQQQHIVRQDNAQHRPLEQQQIGEEPAHRVSRREIEARIDDDQQADAEDHAREHQPQRIEEQAGVQAEGGNPRNARREHLTPHDAGNHAAQYDQGGQGDRPGGKGAGIPAEPDGQGGCQGPQQGQKGEQKQQGSASEAGVRRGAGSPCRGCPSEFLPRCKKMSHSGRICAALGAPATEGRSGPGRRILPRAAPDTVDDWTNIDVTSSLSVAFASQFSPPQA